MSSSKEINKLCYMLFPSLWKESSEASLKMIQLQIYRHVIIKNTCIKLKVKCIEVSMNTHYIEKTLFTYVKGKLGMEIQGDFYSFTLYTSASECFTVILFFYLCRNTWLFLSCGSFTVHTGKQPENRCVPHPS